MRLRAPLLLSLAATVLASSTSAASAATLWTTSGHNVRVTVGATAVATGINVQLTRSPTTVVNHCGDAQLALTVTQNNDTSVAGNVTSSTWNGCTPGLVTGTHTTPWTMTVSGTSFISGTETCWNAAVDNVSFDLLGGSYSGSLTSGVRACQPTAAGAPITLKMLSASTVAGPLTSTGTGRLDGSFALTGTAASYSLTN